MPMRDGEPLEGQPGRTEPDQPGDREGPGAEPADEYFSSGSFSPVTVEFGEDLEADAEGGEEGPRPVAAPGDDSPRVIVQFGEDPGNV